jgi:hypothetical protein
MTNTRPRGLRIWYSKRLRSPKIDSKESIPIHWWSDTTRPASWGNPFLGSSNVYCTHSGSGLTTEQPRQDKNLLYRRDKHQPRKNPFHLSSLSPHLHLSFTSQQGPPLSSLSEEETIFLNSIFFGGIFVFVLYSALLHLPPVRFHCDDGCWD